MKNCIEKLLLTIFLLVVGLMSVEASTLTPTEIIEKSSATISGKEGKIIKFTITAKSGAITGSLITKGNKFALTTKQGLVWYDGKTMTSYNPSTNEATVVVPSSEELLETNPLLFLPGWKKEFTASKAQSSDKSKYIIALTAKTTSSKVRKAVLSVNTHNFNPLKLVINLKNGSVIKVAVNSITASNNISDNNFIFSKKKYPNVEIIDLTR